MTNNDEPVQLPMAPGHVRTAALSELGRVGGFVAGLALENWPRASAVQGWTVGDVVTHLNLALPVYGRLLDAVVAGRGSGGMWKAVGEISKKVAPVAGPAFNAINSAIPRVIDRALSPEVIKAQFGVSARTFQEKLLRVGPEDFNRPVYYRGGPWPLSFFLAAVVNELAIHGWDMASRLRPDAHLSDDARSVLPSFYWSGTPFMLHLPKGTTGTVQVSLSDPDMEMWWSLGAGKPRQGTGQAPSPDATVTGESGTFVLALAGRLTPQDALQSASLQGKGNEDLARALLGSFKVV